ncbi:TetR/AcrR family transcriptional regulator [Streptomyces sp. NBC_00083]|uniref:TetR/AcrR family transcriptional regulator n=1 Tax=Streptomyces sp. NBC_00083 TaxID=2975647 RepID=UPI002255D284|nr:TetR/AcrR family transcriptional regulator [Streptomyces sp. NBC_00083]MCX5384567.1 TetR/AcrR family transcriptional regulator [Streptomyces sp. NBC_00083]
METTPQVSRRERKKAETRRTIADTALRLFFERGYDDVGIREIAQEADVAVATLFAHFPSKEALVFDQDAEQEDMLLDVVRRRPDGVAIPEALRGWLHEVVRAARAEPELERFHRLVDSTPALREHAAQMWLRHEDALARTIAADIGLAAPDIPCRLLARNCLGTIPALRDADRAARVIDETFAFIEAGWNATTSAKGSGLPA